MTPNPRVTHDDFDGQEPFLDDFLAHDVKTVHFEAIDQSRWYLTIDLADGQVWQLHFGAENPRAHGYAFAEQVDR